MKAGSALMLILAAPALVHAAHGGFGEAHRRQVAHVHALEERQILRPILGGGNDTVSCSAYMQSDWQAREGYDHHLNKWMPHLCLTLWLEIYNVWWTWDSTWSHCYNGLPGQS
jgi:hypothetical protein